MSQAISRLCPQTRRFGFEIRTCQSGRKRSGVVFRLFPGFFLVTINSFDQLCGLTDSITQIEQFGAANLTVSFDFNFGDLGAVVRESTFDPFTRDDASHRELFPGSAATSGDDNSVENLDSFLIPFENSLVHFDRITNLKYKGLFAKILIFDLFNQWLNHGFFQFSKDEPSRL